MLQTPVSVMFVCICSGCETVGDLLALGDEARRITTWLLLSSLVLTCLKAEFFEVIATLAVSRRVPCRLRAAGFSKKNYMCVDWFQ